jgi:2-keto-3-deoxy-L-rhamnonate aldolase RhmA
MKMLNKRAMNLKKRLFNGEVTSGIWITLPCPSSCEIISKVGFDWVIVDTEHNSFNPETLLHIAMAFSSSDTSLLMRIPEKTEAYVKQALDTGWDGIIFPQTNTLDDARRVVSLCKYPPIGKRGYGPSRVGNYGIDEDEYVKSANNSVICLIQIENISGAEQIDDIVQVTGIDGIMVGPNDMSSSTDKFRDKTNPVLIEALNKIRTTVQTAGLPFNMGGGDTSDMDKMLAMGCQMIFLGTDSDYLQMTAQNSISMFKEALNLKGVQ